MKEILAYSSLFFSIVANILYIKETLQGKVKPERVSWLLWTLLGATYFVSAVKSDGAVWFTAGELIGPVMILILSIKFGVGGKSKFDQYSLAIALVAFSLLFIVDNVLLSLFLALFVDGVGITLTIRKLLLDPSSESRLFWSLAAIASVLAVLSLNVYNLETLLFPVYVVIISIFIAIKSDSTKQTHLKAIEKL